MACPSLIVPACVISSAVSNAAGVVAGGAMSSLAQSIQSGIAWVVANTVGWWVQVPSPDLATEPAVGMLQRWLLPITAAVAVTAMLLAAGKMTLTRRANPLVDVGSGLAIIAATSAIGVLLPTLLLKAGDAWSSWVLASSTGGQFGARLTAVLTLTGATSGVVIVLGVIAIILTAIQAVLMLFRQAALVVLAGVLPLAAAGTLAPATRAWFRRSTGWMLALMFYKPAAAAVYATAFAMIGAGHDPRTILMGFTMVVLSLLALPALLKFFTWTTGTVDGPAGGGFLGTVVSGAIAVGALRASGAGGGGSSAIDQARLLAAQLGPAGDSGSSSGAGQSPPSADTASAPGQGQRVPGARPAGSPGPGPIAGTGPGGAPPAGAGTSSPPGPPAGSGTGAAAAKGAGGAAATGATAASAAGPAGAAAAGMASGAVSAARQAAEAVQPDQPGPASSEKGE